MKRFIFGIVALVAMATTSCQQFDDADVVGGQTTTVTINLSTPEIANRAFSDGTTATHLQYAVYDADGNALDIYKKDNETINISKQVNFLLTLNDTYSVLFWAASPSAPYNVDLDAKSMTVDYTGAKNSDESRDAFYYYKTFTVSGGMAPIDAKLKRPFAQLNIGTSDLDDAIALTGKPVTHTKVEVPVYTTLNFATGEVSGKQLVEFGYAALPTSEEFPYEPETYDYMAMNYLLMGLTKESVDVKFTYAADENGTNANTRTVGAVPLQRNYRTNLYGQLLTGNGEANTTISPELDINDYLLNYSGAIVYTSTDGAVVEPNASAVFDANITSNTYEDGIGVIYFDAPLTKLESAFRECTTLERIIIPESVTSIGANTFNDCTSLQSVTILDNVTSIGVRAFNNCASLQNITIPNSVTSIARWAFYGCESLTSITIPDSVTSIGYQMFVNCTSLTSATIGSGITKITSSFFDGCTKLQSVTMTNSITQIDHHAFQNCTSIQSITIPDSVTKIGSQAFYGCTGLQEVLCKPTTVPEGGSKMFHYKDSNTDVEMPLNCKIYVPTASVDKYKKASVWSDYAAQIEGKVF